EPSADDGRDARVGVVAARKHLRAAALLRQAAGAIDAAREGAVGTLQRQDRIAERDVAAERPAARERTDSVVEPRKIERHAGNVGKRDDRRIAERRRRARAERAAV